MSIHWYSTEYSSTNYYSNSGITIYSSNQVSYTVNILIFLICLKQLSITDSLTVRATVCTTYSVQTLRYIPESDHRRYIKSFTEFVSDAVLESRIIGLFSTTTGEASLNI